jgi:hypothetical protein
MLLKEASSGLWPAHSVDCVNARLARLKDASAGGIRAVIRCVTGSIEREGRAGLLAEAVQTSTCWAMASASSTCMPRYRTALSIFVMP